MRNVFKEHPNSVGETYFKHFLKSCSFGIKLIFIAARAFIHAILPWCFEHSASEKIKELNDSLQKRRDSVNSNKN
jgi:hypothetical protein